MTTQPWPQMEAAFEDAIRTKDRYQWVGQAAELGWTFAPVEDPLNIVDGPQIRARKFFRQLDVDGTQVQVPGLPYVITTDVAPDDAA